MSEKLTIDFVSGATVGKDLKGCFFVQNNDGTFDFHNKEGHVVVKNITLGSSFQFQLKGDPRTWTLSLGEVLHVKGSWSDGNKVFPDVDGGYQAQAGGSGAGEKGAASAYA